jgi:hypothetical protein
LLEQSTANAQEATEQANKLEIAKAWITVIGICGGECLSISC